MEFYANESKCRKFAFCPYNSPIWPAWEHSGLSMCFYESFASLMVLVSGISILYQTFKRKSYTNLSHDQNNPSKLYKCQVIFLVILICEPIARCATVFALEKTVSGVRLLYSCLRLFSIFVCLWLLYLEQKTSSRKFYHNSAVLLCGLVFLLLEIVCIISWNSKRWWFINSSLVGQVNLGFWSCRLCMTLCFFCSVVFNPKSIYSKYKILIQNYKNSENVTEKYGYGTASTWHDFGRKMYIVFPFMWPTRSIILQLELLVCVGLLVSGRIINVYVPIYYKNLVNSLSNQTSWDNLLKETAVYVGIKSLQEVGLPGGLILALRTFLTIKVQQYSQRTIQVKLFGHLHSLSTKWHLNHNIGEVMESMQRGVTSIAKLLLVIMFQLLPSLFDCIIAIVYFARYFNYWFGLLMFVWITVYAVSSVWIIEWKTKFQRRMNLKDNKAKHIAYDSLLNFATVKCFSTEDFETQKFHKAVEDFQVSEFTKLWSKQLLQTVQTLIIYAGLAGITLLCGKYVLDGTLQVGDFILCETYIAQLYKPLGSFGHYYLEIQNDFINLENILDLFNEKRDLTDIEDAVALHSDAKSIEFDDVCFSYLPRKPVLNHVTFTINAGQTAALVGTSGSGKTTIIRLLLRLFDSNSGTIRLNGSEIKAVQQSSVRNTIGLVPQDCVLFSGDVMSNITYGVNATHEEVTEAANVAGIHHRVLDMPDQYATDVGERGMNLSGGERQRIAVARVVMKDPNILVFDEPTSNLENIAAAKMLQSVHETCSGKTVLIATHNLSVAVDSDCILVLHQGEIVERGKHDDLIRLDGVYAKMWQQQRSLEENANMPNVFSCSINT